MSTDTMERPVAAAPVVALTPPQRAAVALNTAEYEIKLRELLTNSVAILAVTNKAGRDECHTAYMVLKNTRCAITNLSEGATEDAKAFTKAVKAEAVRLIAITTAEEDRLEGLRDGWDEAEKARKAALIAAEKERVERIQHDIQSIRDLVAMAAGKPSSAIAEAIEVLTAIQMTGGRFEEFAPAAIQAVAETGDKLGEMHEAALASEAAALAAEEARKAEAKRAADEAAAVAKQKEENERVANEHAATAKRLADQEAEQDALAEQVRIQREAAAEQQRQLAEQQAEFEALRAAFVREQEEAAARVEAAAKLEADHPQGLIDNAQFDADREAERVRKQAMADQHLADKRDLPRPESATVLDAMIDAGEAEEPFIDYEAIAWAYQKLLAYGVGNTGMDNALMLDRLNLMLLTAEA
jgi:DNA segregation ATPase FtsK/SpoIIIE-like protein